MTRIYNKSENQAHAIDFNGRTYIVQPKQGEYKRTQEEKIVIKEDPVSGKKSRVRIIEYGWKRVSDKRMRNYVDGPEGLALKIQQGDIRKRHGGDLVVQRDYDKEADLEFQAKQTALRELDEKIAERQRQLGASSPASRVDAPELGSQHAESPSADSALPADGRRQPLRSRGQ